LPSRTVLLTYDPGSVFRHLGAEAEEQLRADVVLVPLSLLHFPGMVDALVDRNPELRGLLSEHVMSGKLSLDKLQSLSAERPVLLELAEEVPANVYGTLISDAWFQRVLPDGATLADAQTGGALHFAALSRLSLSADSARSALPEALRQGSELKLARMHFFHGLLAGSLGDLPGARESLARGEQVRPGDAALQLLETKLPERGRLSAESVLAPLREASDSADESEREPP
jgi:hypothetical protein